VEILNYDKPWSLARGLARPEVTTEFILRTIYYERRIPVVEYFHNMKRRSLTHTSRAVCLENFFNIMALLTIKGLSIHSTYPYGGTYPSH
jgi:hypothetical protein